MKGASFAAGCGLSALALHPARLSKIADAQIATQKGFLDSKFI
jgi:hypothetical protein